MSSAAVSRAARRLGRSPAGRSRRAARDAADARDRGAPHREVSPSLSAPILSAPTTPRPTPSAFCTGRCAGSGSLVMRAADAHQVPAGGALAVDRERFSRGGRGGDPRRAAHHVGARRDRGAAAGGLGANHHRHRPADLAGARRGDPRGDRRAIARLLRRHRADRSFRQHRFRHRMASIALRQGGPRRRRRGLRQLPARPRRATRLSSTRLLAAEKTEFREFEGTPYFDGCLPIEVMAERGRETLRHGPMKPVGLTNAHDPAQKALRRRATAPGQRARHAVQHGRLPDQAQIWRTGARVSHDPRPRARRIRAARRPAPQHLSQFAAPARRCACG